MKNPPILNRGLFDWNACKLADEYTTNELVAALKEIAAAPENQTPDHEQSIYLLTLGARKTSDALTWAIRYRHQKESEQAA